MNSEKAYCFLTEYDAYDPNTGITKPIKSGTILKVVALLSNPTRGDATWSLTSDTVKFLTLQCQKNASLSEQFGAATGIGFLENVDNMVGLKLKNIRSIFLISSVKNAFSSGSLA